MDLWDGNNEPFITRNETARKNKHTQKNTFYQKPVLPKASGVQGTERSGFWAKSYSKSCPTSPSCPVLLLSCQPDQAALTTWWRRALVFSKCVLGGCFTFLIKMWSHVATLNKCSCVRIAQF